jgi:hypothetical protein
MVARIFQRPPARARTATPLLAYIAGEFADAAAQVWPAPHGDFFALPAARRHAAAIALAGYARREVSAGELRRLVEYARDAAVADALIGAEAAPGLMRALSKAGERLWRREDYEIFLDLFREPMANEVLRHLDEIAPDRFARIAELPPPLRLATIVRVLPSWSAAADLALAYRLAVRMRHAGDATRIANRWGAGGDVRAVFSRAQQDLTPDAFRPAGPAPALGPGFTRVTARKQLETLALNFRNCLADHASRIAEGRMAVYHWRDDIDAAVALNWDAAGWRLAEAKAPDNLDLEEIYLRKLVKLLEAAGVRTGLSVYVLGNRLDEYANGVNYVVPLGPGFVGQLALGDLWN